MEDNNDTVVVVTDVGTATVEPVLLIEEDVVEPDVVVVVVVNDAGRLYRCGYREDDDEVGRMEGSGTEQLGGKGGKWAGVSCNAIKLNKTIE